MPVVVVALLGLLVPAGAQAEDIPLSSVNAAVLLGSDQTTATPTSADAAWTAEIVRPVVARTAPNIEAVARTTLQPYDVGTSPTTLLATRGFRDRLKHDWVRVQLSLRPNQTAAWVPADAVILTATDTRIVIHLTRRRLDVWRSTRRVLSAPAGIGRAATPTPTGQFAIDDIWETDAATRGIYGRFVLALTAHSNVLLHFDGGDGRIAIHGGGGPGRVGARASFGCIIVSDRVLQRLSHLARRGTPVTVLAD
jgi:lipoprotein-anchoring transpeptidase ErfK/SrfK